MLMVGAAGRNLGKTTFICRAIERLSKVQPVVAIKVTAFDDVDGEIVAATQKCQTHKTLQGRFMVTCEGEGPGEKDTHRMFHAGAEKVYWLRTLRSALADGMRAVLNQMRDDGTPREHTCIICESNSARKAVEPGLFLIVREMGDDFKPSCAEVYDGREELTDGERQGAAAGRRGSNDRKNSRAATRQFPRGASKRRSRKICYSRCLLCA